MQRGFGLTACVRRDLNESLCQMCHPKVVMYNNCGGERMALDVDNIGTNMYGDLAKQGLLDFNYRVMNLKEGSYEQIPHTGLSPHYVYRETKCTPQSVKTAVTAAFQAERSGRVAFS